MKNNDFQSCKNYVNFNDSKYEEIIMFTGIIETIGEIKHIERKGTNIHFVIGCDFAEDLKIDQSIAHDGCCLTVDGLENGNYGVTAIQETLSKTNLCDWEIGTKVNLERCVQINARLDGHIVQGHIDQIGIIKSIENRDGSYYIRIQYEDINKFTTIPQGSIAVNGISLTVAYSGDNEFAVAIIPYTWENTNLRYLKNGDKVNLEFDVIGKYISKLMKKY